MFAPQNTITASPPGSPTAESLEVKAVIAWEEWLTLHRDFSMIKRSRKPKLVQSL